MKNPVHSLFVAAAGALSFAYLINPTAGVLEFIPDNFPIVGNIDEAAASAILIAALAYFGLDVTRLFKSGDKNAGTVATSPKVVDVEVSRVNPPGR